MVGWYMWGTRGKLPPLKINMSPEKGPSKKRENSLPTITFPGDTLVFLGVSGSIFRYHIASTRWEIPTLSPKVFYFRAVPGIILQVFTGVCFFLWIDFFLNSMGCNSQQSQQLHWHLTTTCEIRQGLLGLFHYLLTGQPKLKALSFGGEAILKFGTLIASRLIESIQIQNRCREAFITTFSFSNATHQETTPIQTKNHGNLRVPPPSPLLSLNDPLIRPSISCGETWHWGVGPLGICMRKKNLHTKNRKNWFLENVQVKKLQGDVEALKQEPENLRNVRMWWMRWPPLHPWKWRNVPWFQGTILGGKDRHGLFQTLWDWEIFIFRV